MSAWTLYAQWTGVFGAFWLTWWAARSHDALAYRIIAVTLVILPAVAIPIAVLVVQNADRLGSGRFMIVSIATGVVGVVRGLFLIFWALLSKDTNALRAVGLVAAALMLAGVAAQIAFVSVVASGGG
ncbi:MAG: hypothetical protein E7773_03010 [Sphingomonas sp.]|uniref:hypothetical protein n=1 Tax=Sphingomonas sp. TaxID=28214 RepID=UPI0011F4B511|nr:hypothetical protein [Sphingomonas sp.]THD37962.1 MAG: hypothetical protein E7773_03010 [Sphingomonas sp.]